MANDIPQWYEGTHLKTVIDNESDQALIDIMRSNPVAILIQPETENLAIQHIMEEVSHPYKQRLRQEGATLELECLSLRIARIADLGTSLANAPGEKHAMEKIIIEQTQKRHSFS